ncbi:ubiquinol-cytochrome c reductase iron-sulfur subunit [Denitratisoma oestradiolicum]|uniref:Ubiquinol-cytochrome c reductase iron-sulfur subunit n=1 Tax=Denitratisoma oestradiolicum TaxID=311182 RepID=A0A6S6XWM6_9PROT|nr:ubiquinol-cytochrome c reductase iron-sulfur subunit [Denitratisoma oestradiolicum]TWO81311.1 ubiquinol-cytochrome c reductase iron-sulfur subunit [Denitratisoma oestradiolicum]CAB1368497.1 Ubiquinol-cytochrome c reductase iron-sulfur subunit [Denitratisoma oestradiolicum]
MSSSDEKVDCGRRRLLVATAAAGGVVGVAATVPFLASMAPSERAKSAGAPVEVDISKLEPGQMTTVEWRGKPVWIIHRTPEMLESLKKTDEKVADPKSERKQAEFPPPDGIDPETRALKPEYMVVVGICTHLGCSPTDKFKTGAESGVDPDWAGGFLCPCHGSTFDLAGRVYKNKPAPDNLPIPPHVYLSESKILIGENKQGA